MPTYNFDKSIKEVLEKHGVDNPELESALNDIFKRYESRILSKDFVEEIFKIKDEIDKRRKAAFGG